MVRITNFNEVLYKSIGTDAYHKVARLARFHKISLEKAVEDCINSAQDLGEKEKKDLEERDREELRKSREM